MLVPPCFHIDSPFGTKSGWDGRYGIRPAESGAFIMNLFAKPVSGAIRRIRAMVTSPFARGSASLAALDPVIAELEVLNRSTEQDFLAVGEQLAGFRTVARRISGDMAALTDLISGEHGRKASEALARMLDCATQMCDRTARSGDALSGVQKISGRIRADFCKLVETVATIRALCPLTRIETSRLGAASADFIDLSDAVTPLSDSIQSSGKNVMEASALLDKCIQSGIRHGVERSARQVKEVRSLITSVVESLGCFEQRQQRAREASLRQKEQHAAVCAAIEDLVHAIQFQDITRQQIEHVAEALGKMRSGAGSRTGLRLQSSQLKVAGETFARSIAQIEANLGTIAARVAEMAEAARTLLGFSENEGDSFFLQMEDRFGRILEAAGACGKGQCAVQSTVSELTTTISAMRESVQEIRTIEIQIQRIALNATIRSAHIGSRGDALNTIAAVMHRVSFDSSRNTEEVATLLDSLSEASGRVNGDECGAQPDTEIILGELRGEIADLHTSSQSSFAHVHRIASLGSELSEALRSARAELKVGPLFAHTIAQACGELDRVAAGCAVHSGIGEFEKHYSMQSERDVHASVVRDGLGDNVDLF